MPNWFLRGPDWIENINLDEEYEPIEIATRGLEQKLKKHSYNLTFNLGIILELFHSEMKSELEHFVILTSTVLANAGFYSEATSLEKAINSATSKNK